MVQVDIVYEGNLHCRATHLPSGSVIETDAPKDNMGKGERFSPTDLVATALGTCILSIMGILARNMQIDLTGTKVTVIKEMVTVPVRRIGKLGVTVHVPVLLDDVQKQKLFNGAHTCPVHKSLHPDIQAPIEFIWNI